MYTKIRRNLGAVSGGFLTESQRSFTFKAQYWYGESMGLRNHIPRWLGGVENQRALEATLDTYFASLLDAERDSGTPNNLASLLGIPAFACGVGLISQSIAGVPLSVSQDGEEAEDHPVSRLFNVSPNAYLSPFAFRELLVVHLLVYGQFIAQIQRGPDGIPVGLSALDSSQFKPRIIGRDLYYEGHVDDREVRLAAEEVFRVVGISLDGLTGSAPTSMFQGLLAGVHATYDYGHTFFTEGGKPKGVITADNPTPIQIKQMSEQLDTAAKQGKTAVLLAGSQYQPITMPPDDAQFLETRLANVLEVCRILNIPPAMVHDLSSGTYSNVAQQTTSFVDLTVRPITRRIESAIQSQLLEEGYDVRFDVGTLYSSDQASRYESYVAALAAGFLTVNEVREMEGLPPLDESELQQPVEEETVVVEDVA